MWWTRGGGRQRDLQFIHNVRPVMALGDPPRVSRAPLLMTVCILVALGALLLLFEEVTKTGRVPFRYYAMMIGLLSGGLGLIGIGQGLRLLLLILGKE